MTDLFREVVVVPERRLELKLAQITKAVEEAELDLRGWPVLFLRSAKMVSHDDSSVSCYIEPTWSGLEFGWTIDRTGLIFHKEKSSESTHDDERWADLFDPVLRILEFAEFLAVACRFYQAVGAPDEMTLSVRFSWTGAKGRVIAYNGNPGAVSAARFQDRRVGINSPSCKVEISVGTSSKEIPGFVLRLFRDLFDDLTNDMRTIDDETIIEWANKCLERRL